MRQTARTVTSYLLLIPISLGAGKEKEKKAVTKIIIIIIIIEKSFFGEKSLFGLDSFFSGVLKGYCKYIWLKIVFMDQSQTKKLNEKVNVSDEFVEFK